MQKLKLDQLIHARFDALYARLVLREENARAGNERQAVASCSKSLTDAHRNSQDCNSLAHAQSRGSSGPEVVDSARCSICYDFTRPEAQWDADSASGSGKRDKHKRKRASDPCARLSPCDHIYHRRCIEPWLELRSTCPLCRVPVTHATYDDEAEPRPIEPTNKKLHVEDAFQPYDDLVCSICHNGDDADVMLLCDGCDAGFHTYCLHMDRIPVDDWYCKRCRDTMSAQQRPLPSRTERGD
mmetsp:Transcript_5207/g.10623  ORF Transcript_5207/g.10623 Transcript_5207/m.10623 type:complete len:241 (+) Transcript_5207:272-994(+)|eukprot:CAMPEP_0118934270 /NCGR_PEP_ID=MMETSP1169-20130426/13732_1 /TAXON_ID=36882 /ORGANISM="Pyramimonas obovata, Strain CCMP722" /LENGTH=240 /DNA_ID=CAMNT_0006877153 /DNA_START=265 /DNA_END=987 /DNA_ORIENTATION=-